MPIAKAAQRTHHLHRPTLAFPDARSGFKAFLQAAELAPEDQVLLPAYVGWSPREGSGVLDPVAELGLSYAFYRLDEHLRIDLEHLASLLLHRRVKVFVIIHYFGYVDPAYPQAVAMAREHGALVLEDEAHAMLTDLIGGGSGRLGDACIFSLHKMLPLPDGGLLVLNTQGPLAQTLLASKTRSTEPYRPAVSPFDFDLWEIARRRRENALRLTELLEPLADEVVSLWGDPTPQQVPQTYPVIIRRAPRDQLYQVMNDAGFGVVSLYHTMVAPITADAFPQSHWLSRHIMNLPLHQDITPDALEALVKCLAEQTR